MRVPWSAQSRSRSVPAPSLILSSGSVSSIRGSTRATGRERSPPNCSPGWSSGVLRLSLPQAPRAALGVRRQRRQRERGLSQWRALRWPLSPTRGPAAEKGTDPAAFRARRAEHRVAVPSVAGPREGQRPEFVERQFSVWRRHFGDDESHPAPRRSARRDSRACRRSSGPWSIPNGSAQRRSRSRFSRPPPAPS